MHTVQLGVGLSKTTPPRPARLDQTVHPALNVEEWDIIRVIVQDHRIARVRKIDLQFKMQVNSIPSTRETSNH